MTLSALLTGFAIGAVVFSVLMLAVVRNVRKGLADDMAAKERALDEIRREASEDRETNRRLRHEIHQMQHGQYALASVGSGPSGATVGEGYDDYPGSAPSEPSWPSPSDGDDGADQSAGDHADALIQIDSLEAELKDANLRIAASESKLKRYRETLTEIRESLEARDPLANLVHITEEVPTTPSADASSGAA